MEEVAGDAGRGGEKERDAGVPNPAKAAHPKDVEQIVASGASSPENEKADPGEEHG